MGTLYEALRDAITAQQPVVVATVIEGSTMVGAHLLASHDTVIFGDLGDATLQESVLRDSRELLRQAENGTRSYPTAAGTVQVFIESYPPPPVLFIVGAVHIAIALTTLAQTLGFRVVVVDARGVFATPDRFAHADELIHAWPDEALVGRLHSNSYVVLLTHDPKLDDPALKLALPSAARYIGALGSVKTHQRRLERLRADGVPEAQLARLHAPIGLKLGAVTPEEIAVSIIAEIVAARHGLTTQSRLTP